MIGGDFVVIDVRSHGESRSAWLISHEAKFINMILYN